MSSALIAQHLADLRCLDPERFELLEGEGKLRRHIKLHSVPDITLKPVDVYLLLVLKAGHIATAAFILL